jgi:hypothetical protein
MTDARLVQAPCLAMLAAAWTAALFGGCAGADLPCGSTTLPAKAVDPDDLRWRDTPGELYAAGFRDPDFYFNVGSVAINWDEYSQTLSGTLVATSIKPNFAYQMKLIGKGGVTSSATPPSAETDPEGWASWQLGHNGRWWCYDCEWNVTDAELASHVSQGHTVVGYLLFDFFITDRDGDATKPFSLDSSYHVLWRTDQRTPESNDSAVVTHTVWRGLWGYNNSPAVEGPTVGVYAEWEPGRPTPGTLSLPVGTYPVRFNITEESFHDNLGNTVPFGGFWAQVYEGDLTFTTYPLAVRWPR